MQRPDEKKDHRKKEIDTMHPSRLSAAAAAALALLASGSLSAAEVEISGLIAEGFYYTNPETGNDALKMAGYKETPWDSAVNLKGRENLSGDWYVGFGLGATIALDTGSLANQDHLFGSSRIFVGNRDIEFSFGRIANFSCATQPYSVYMRLRANMTGASFVGIAPANVTFNAPENLDNAVAFSTKAQKGFFLQGLYSNGTEAQEKDYGWSDRNIVAQLAGGWVGEKLRVGTILSWERPDHLPNASGTRTDRKDDTYGIHLIGSCDFGGVIGAVTYYHGENDWRVGAAPDLRTTMVGAGAYDKSTEGLRSDAVVVTAAVPVGRHTFTGALTYAKFDWQGNADGVDDTEGTVLSGGTVYYYALSKRTRVYLAASYADGEKLLDGPARFNQFMGAAGMMHNF